MKSTFNSRILRITPGVHCKTKSLWTEENALRLVGQRIIVYYELLKPGETVNTDRYRQQIMDRALYKKMAKITETSTQSNSFARQYSITYSNTSHWNTWGPKLGNSSSCGFLIRPVHETLHETKNYMHRWETPLPNSAQIPSKMSKND